MVTGPAVPLENAVGTTSFGTLVPFGPLEMQQTPELSDGLGTASLEDRLFKHDYTFMVPSGAPGVSNLNDINLLLQNRLLIDILQLTFGLFEGTVDPMNLVTPPGLVQDPAGEEAGTLSFVGLTPGVTYILRVAGVLNGFGVIAGSDVEGWHGEYQGNLAIAPVPGALVLFASALVGLGLVGWRRSVSQA
jgi:hypothetical protein